MPMKPLHAILLLPLLSFAVNIEAQTLDPTFGTSGIAQTTIGAASAGFGITTQADGRILCAGGSDSSAVLVRYLSNGGMIELPVQKRSARHPSWLRRR